VSECIESGDNNMDVSGENKLMERMKLEYNKEDEEKGVYDISYCGFESVKDDIGKVIMMKKFKGDLNYVEN
jgi:short subunit dehydrogenase-like uncharacterized protein